MKRYVDGVEMPVGQATMAASRPVVIASDQTPIPTTGTLTGPVDQGAAGTDPWVVTLEDAAGNPLVGQKTMAESVPTTLAIDQSPVPITAAALPLPADAATNTSLGTDGSAGPADGTGIRGWLHGISDYLAGTLQTDVTDRVGRLLGNVQARLYDAAGVALSAANPLFVRLSDGAAAQGTSGNPLFVSTTSASISTVNFARTAIDAFARLRVSEPYTLFDSKYLSDNGPAFWDDVQVSGAGTSSTYTQTLAQVALGVSNLTAGRRTRQTFRRFNYQPGKSQLVDLTGVFGLPTTGITRRIGQFSSSNGLFLRNTAAGNAFVVRLNGAENPVAQVDWNLDTFSGLGGARNPSGIALDFSKTQILVINYEWLGVGSVWFGFVVGGVLYWAQRFDNANVFATVYMGTPNLPLQYEIENDGTGPAASLHQICSTVITEGGRSITGLPRATDRDVTPLTVNSAASTFPLLCLRLTPDATLPGASSTLMEPTDFDILNLGNDPFLWRVLLDPTFAGAALSWLTITQSAVQVARPTNATTITGGVQIGGGYQVSGLRAGGTLTAALGTDFSLGTFYNGTPQILTLAVRRIGTNNGNMYAAAGWRETT